MVDGVRAALVQNRPEVEEDLRGILPPHLEQVFVQLPHSPQFMCCGGAEGYGVDCAGCHELASEDERFAVLRPNADGNKSQGIAKQEWFDRISGGEGGWAVEDRIIGISDLQENGGL